MKGKEGGMIQGRYRAAQNLFDALSVPSYRAMMQKYPLKRGEEKEKRKRRTYNEGLGKPGLSQRRAGL